MIDSAAYAEALSRIQSGKPKLASFFVTACQRAATLVDLDTQTVRSISQLTVASEYTYIDADTLLPVAIRRGELSVFCQLAYDLSAVSPEYARAVLARYPPLTVPAGSLSGDLRSLASLCAARTKKGDLAIAFCLSFRETDVIRTLLRKLVAVASASPGALPELIQSFSKVRRAIPQAAFLSWLSRGVDLLTSNRLDEGVRFLRARSPESRKALGIPSAVLDDLKRVLKIYATSLSGRELSVVSLESSTFAATVPYSDGRVMFLPPEVRFFGRQELNERVYTVLAAQQAASVRMGSFGFDFQKIDFRADLADRYGTSLPRVMAEVRKQYGKVARSIRERASGDVEVIFQSGRRIVLLETDLERFFYRFPAPDFARAFHPRRELPGPALPLPAVSGAPGGLPSSGQSPLVASAGPAGSRHGRQRQIPRCPGMRGPVRSHRHMEVHRDGPGRGAACEGHRPGVGPGRASRGNGRGQRQGLFPGVQPLPRQLLCHRLV